MWLNSQETCLVLQGREVLAQGSQVGLSSRAGELHLFQRALQAPALSTRCVRLHLQLCMLRLRRIYLLQHIKKIV